MPLPHAVLPLDAHRGRRCLIACLALLLGSCMLPEPNPERLRCFHACAVQKDGCMLHAANADQVQFCDLQSQQCSGACPP